MPASQQSYPRRVLRLYCQIAGSIANLPVDVRLAERPSRSTAFPTVPLAKQDEVSDRIELGTG